MRLIDQVEMVGEMCARGVISPVVAVEMLAETAGISRALAAALLIDDARARAGEWAPLGDDWGRWEAL